MATHEEPLRYIRRFVVVAEDLTSVGAAVKAAYSEESFNLQK
jgi:hypothetical protein